MIVVLMKWLPISPTSQDKANVRIIGYNLRGGVRIYGDIGQVSVGSEASNTSSVEFGGTAPVPAKLRRKLFVAVTVIQIRECVGLTSIQRWKIKINGEALRSVPTS